MHDAVEAPAAESWYTAREAARVLGVHERTIRRAIARGDLAASRRNGRFAIASTGLQAFARQNCPPRGLPKNEGRAPRDPGRGALPVPPTAIVGREHEIDRALAHLSGPAGRLLTLTGPGGAGKTRLAMAIAAPLALTMPDGASFVRLETVRSPDQVISAISQSLGIAPAEGQLPFHALIEGVRLRRQIVILDNFEHLVDAAPLIADLLAAAPGLQVLVTSREALRLRGETELIVPPLATPTPDTPRTPEAISGFPAVELFVRRARQARADVHLTNDNASSISAICRQLDGLPLALELAAAQIKHFTPEEIEARLVHRLDNLVDGPRDLPSRLQTMRAAIGWSYSLLSDEERRVLRCLSVFSGGFTAETATALFAPVDFGEDSLRLQPGEAPADLLRILRALVDKSLLQPVADSAERRFAMLETIREFAAEQLAASREATVIPERHARIFLAHVEQAAAACHRRTEAAALRRLEPELGNMRVALIWAAGPSGSVELALRLANGLFWFWYTRGYYAEAWTWTIELLARPEQASTPQSRLLTAINASWLALHLGQPDEALRFATDADVSSQRFDLPWHAAYARGSLGFMTLVAGQNPLAAVPLLEQGRAAALAVGDTWLISMITYGLGIATMALGNTSGARELCEDSLRACQDAGDAQGIAANLAVLGQLARMRGATDEAFTLFTSALEQFQRMGDRDNVCTCIESLAGILVTLNRPEEAARLLGAAAAARERIGTPVPLREQARYAHDVAAAREALTASAFESAWRTGETSPLPALLAELTRQPEKPPPAASRVKRSAMPSRLTRREQQVLELVSEGHTDREIAEILSISPETVTKHIGNMLGKLGVRSRTAAAIHYLTTTRPTTSISS